MLKIFNNGSSIYPGANYVIKNGERYSTDNAKIKLELGDTLLRHIMNDDYVLLNR